MLKQLLPLLLIICQAVLADNAKTVPSSHPIEQSSAMQKNYYLKYREGELDTLVSKLTAQHITIIEQLKELNIVTVQLTDAALAQLQHELEMQSNAQQSKTEKVSVSPIIYIEAIPEEQIPEPEL